MWSTSPAEGTSIYRAGFGFVMTREDALTEKSLMSETNPLGSHTIASWPRHFLRHEKENLQVLFVSPAQCRAELL
jgi:hypothetical protein